MAARAQAQNSNTVACSFQFIQEYYGVILFYNRSRSHLIGERDCSRQVKLQIPPLMSAAAIKNVKKKITALHN